MTDAARVPHLAMHARTVAAVIVALVVGLAIGFAVGSAPTSGSEVSRAEVEGASANDARVSAGVPRDELAASEANARTSGPATDEASVPPGATTRAAARAPAASTPTADGVISGRVVDASGAGVANVEVRVRATATDAPQVLSGDFDGSTSLPALEAHLESAALAWSAARSREAATRTDADGRFELPALGDSEGCRVEAHLAGWSVTPRGANERRFAGERVEFLAQRLAAVEFALLREDGTPFEEGVVEVVERGRTQFHVWRRDAPVFALAPGYVEVRAHDMVEFASGVPRWNLASAKVTLELLEGAARHVELVLLRSTRVVGRVEETSGRLSQRRVSVIARQHVDGRAPTDSELKSGVRFVPARNGEFDVRDYEPGPWEFAVRDSHGNFVARATVEVVVGATQVRLVLPPEDPSAVLRVRVFEPLGRTASDFTIEAVLANGSTRNVALGESDGEGWYTVRLCDFVSATAASDPWSELDGLRLQAVSRLAPFAGSVDVPLRATEVTLHLGAPSVVEVFVHGLVGTPHSESARVTAARSDADPRGGADSPWRSARGTRVGTTATWTFERLAPGVHDFHVRVARAGQPNSPDDRVAASQRVDVQPGMQRIELMLPTFHTLDVSAPGLHEGARFELVPIEGGSRPQGAVAERDYGTLDALRRLHFDDVTPGRYALECVDLQERVEFDVPCAELVIDVPVWNAQRVVMTEPNGPFSAAGLRDGDLVVELDGAAPLTPSRWNRLFHRNPDDPCDVVVLRGGERVTLDLRPVVAAHHGDGHFDGEFVRTSVER